MDPFRKRQHKGAQGWGCGHREGTGSQEDSGGSTPKAVLHGPNITLQKYIFQGQKKPVCFGRGFLAVPCVPRQELDEEVSGWIPT